MNNNIDFADWGLVEYNEAWNRQEEVFSATIEDKIQGKETKNLLVFCEHPHVYTLGKSGDEHNLLLNYIQLQAKDAQFVRTNRGGDITYHGPGQLWEYRDWETDRKSTRLNSSHITRSRMPSSA